MAGLRFQYNVVYQEILAATVFGTYTALVKTGVENRGFFAAKIYATDQSDLRIGVSRTLCIRCVRKLPPRVVPCTRLNQR